MISCTEFIPAYSELFSYLDENLGGHEEVERFWTYLFKPDGKGIPLINYARKDGLRGCWNYWAGTLTEEAAEVTRYINEKDGWILSECHYCPSKGRLLQLEKEIGLKPYYDYCGHCDYYRSAIEMVGLAWIRNHLDVDRASCQSILYDPKIFRGVIRKDGNTEVMEIRSKEHEYFHRDFHSSLNMGLDYLGRVHGLEHLKKYLARYTVNVYGKTIEKARIDPFAALSELICSTYASEKAEDVLSVKRTERTLSVSIAHCPAVRHLRNTGREVSPYFSYSTEAVMATLAEKAGICFTMDSYDEDTGAASYHFDK